MANTYGASTGERFTTAQIDVKIRIAKKQVLDNQFDEFGYNFCQQCGCNGSETRLDCSHNIPVKKSKENGKVEECWSVENISILCRKHHQEKDKLNLQF